MVAGISNSLNSLFQRMSYIENNFSALENISRDINPAQIQQNQTPSQTQDFQTILEGKIKESNEEITTSQTNIKPTLLDKIQKTPSRDKILDEEIEKLKKEAFEIKGKIDLKSQATGVDEIVETFATKYNVDSDFIKAIIQKESNFNEKATSKKGAMGLMQLMPATAKSLGVINAYNPWENVEGGVKYLKDLLKTYNGDKKLALAAYNAGMGAVKKYGGIPPYKETQNYVKSIMATYEKVKEAKS